MVQEAPMIGICAAYDRAKWGFWEMPAAVVAETYLGHLATEGAVPLAIVPSEATASNSQQIVSQLDGLLLLGGSDVDPSTYGQEPEPELEATMPLRDRSELALVTEALRVGVPILGVCRGLQIMNVATGGTLHQDIGELGPLRHRQNPGKLDESTFHDITVGASSLLAEALGDGNHVVNSHHHQAIDRVGEGGRVVAWSPEDEIVEAVEWGQHFALGVQWHPETAATGGVISTFVQHSRAYRAQRA